MSNGKKLPQRSSSNAAMFQAPATSQGNAPAGRMTAKQWYSGVSNMAAEPSYLDRIQALLPKGANPKGFVERSMLYLRNKPELWECEPKKLLECFVIVAQQGLDFGLPNEAHIVAFKNVPSVIRGYKGDMKMARRAQSLSFLDVNEVYENDECEVSLGDQPKLMHKIPKLGTPRGKVVGFYAVARDRDGNAFYIVMDNDQVHAHARRFVKARNTGPFAGVVENGPGADNWIPYGLKTVVRRLCERKLDLQSQMELNYDKEDAALSESNVIDMGDAFDDTLRAEPVEEKKPEPKKEAPAPAEPAKLDPPLVAEELPKAAEPVTVAGWEPTPEELAEIAAAEAELNK